VDVVDPDLIAVLQITRNGVRESLVGGLVCRKSLDIERDFIKLVVEEWPDGGICSKQSSVR
jgi:hypothetical protein